MFPTGKLKGFSLCCRFVLIPSMNIPLTFF